MRHEPFAYVINNSIMNLKIAIVNIDSLYVHEDTVPELLNQLTHSIQAADCVIDPIIVDENSMVVLDGVHRVVALKRLGAKRVPACLVDYKTPKIHVFNWYRTLTDDAPIIESTIRRLKKSGISLEQTRRVDEDRIGVTPVVAAVRFDRRALIVKSPFHEMQEAYVVVQRVEECFEIGGFKVRYETRTDALRNLRMGIVDGVIYTPRVDKKRIIEAAVSGRVFGPKATRHVIPARPMRVNVPLELLKNARMSLDDVNRELRSMLQRRRVKRIPSGGLLDGRRYEEELFVFEGG